MNVKWTFLRGQRILVVDDWEEITSMLASILSESGAVVSTVNSGRDALFYINTGTYDLIVLDLIMPEPDGWQILEHLQRNRPELLHRTVVLTAARYDRPEMEALKPYGVEYLFKPFLIKELRLIACRILTRPFPPIAA